MELFEFLKPQKNHNEEMIEKSSNSIATKGEKETDAAT